MKITNSVNDRLTQIIFHVSLLTVIFWYTSTSLSTSDSVNFVFRVIFSVNFSIFFFFWILSEPLEVMMRTMMED